MAAGTLRLRSERAGNADGRVYLVVTATNDGSGNTAHACCTVTVPLGADGASIASVNAQAAAARNYCLANGTPPPQFFLVGDGPVVGPQQ